MVKIIIASAMTAFVLWLVIYYRRKAEKHKKDDFLIDNFSFFRFKDD